MSERERERSKSNGVIEQPAFGSTNSVNFVSSKLHRHILGVLGSVMVNKLD